MSYFAYGESYIIIDIQAENKAEILRCVHASFEYMPGWAYTAAADNAEKNHPEERFFAFNLKSKTFDWWRTNLSLSDTMDEDEVPIKDMADISHLLEFIFLNTEKLRENPQPSPTPKVPVVDYSMGMTSIFDNQKMTAEEKKRAEEKQKKFSKQIMEAVEEYSKKIIITMPKAPSYPKYEGYNDDWSESSYNNPWSGGKSKYYYDHKDLDDYEYMDYISLVDMASTFDQLEKLYHKLLGLHGPRVIKIRSLIQKKHNLIKEAEAKAKKKAASGEFNSWGSYAEAEKLKKAGKTYWTSVQKLKDDAYQKHYYKKVYYYNEHGDVFVKVSNEYKKSYDDSW